MLSAASLGAVCGSGRRHQAADVRITRLVPADKGSDDAFRPDALDTPKRWQPAPRVEQLFATWVPALERVSGSHHILRHQTVPVRLNLQPLQRQAKPYQLRQFLSLVERYGLQWRQPDV